MQLKQGRDGTTDMTVNSPGTTGTGTAKGEGGGTTDMTVNTPDTTDTGTAWGREVAQLT